MIGGGGDLAEEARQRGIRLRAPGRELRLRPHARRQLARHERDAQQHHDGDDILRIVDRERADRRQEEEIIGDRRGQPREEPRAQPEQARRDHHRQQIEQGQVAEIEDAEQAAPAERHRGDHHQRPQIIARRAPVRYRPAGARPRHPRIGHGQYVDRHVGGLAHQPIDHRSVQQLEPARPRRLADDELRRARFPAIADQPGQHGCRRSRGDAAAELPGQRHRRRQPLALRPGEPLAAAGLDMHGGPRRALGIGDALGGADQPVGTRQFADRDHDPLAPRPGARQRMAADIVQHLRIHRLRGAAQRQFAQRRQVGFGEEVVECAGRLVGHIHLALLQPLDQLVGGNVDHLDLGRLQDAVGHRLAHADARERGDDVVQALDMLDVDGGIDVDPRRQQFLDILVALRVAAAGDVGVRQLVDQHQPGVAREDGVQIHLGERAAVRRHLVARHDLVAARQRLGLGAPVRLDHADDDIGASTRACLALGQHLVGLADTRRRAEEHLEATDTLPRGDAQEGIGIGPVVGHVHGCGVAPSPSSCRLRSSTFTRASPMKPSSGCRVEVSTSASSLAGSMPRAFATRAT